MTDPLTAPALAQALVELREALMARTRHHDISPLRPEADRLVLEKLDAAAALRAAVRGAETPLECGCFVTSRCLIHQPIDGQDATAAVPPAPVPLRSGDDPGQCRVCGAWLQGSDAIHQHAQFHAAEAAPLPPQGEQDSDRFGFAREDILAKADAHIGRILTLLDNPDVRLKEVHAAVEAARDARDLLRATAPRAGQETLTQDAWATLAAKLKHERIPAGTPRDDATDGDLIEDDAYARVQRWMREIEAAAPPPPPPPPEPRRAHSRSEYRRITTQGGTILPPAR